MIFVLKMYFPHKVGIYVVWPEHVSTMFKLSVRSPIFPPVYKHTKDHFWSQDERERQFPPKLCLQVWDNDKFSWDAFLGELTIDLTRAPTPAPTQRACTLKAFYGDTGACTLERV